jgi:hypothetical protein
MPGADILIASVHPDGSTAISDRYATQKATPLIDDCSHWTVKSGSEENGVTTVEVVRKLNTEDTQDRPIVIGLMKVKSFQNSSNKKIIFAYGSSDTFAYHGEHRYFTSVAFITDPNQFLPDETGWGSRDLITTTSVSMRAPSKPYN